MAAAHPAPSPEPAIETITLGKARDGWLTGIKGSTLPKTWTIKKTAVEMLTSFLGERTKIHAITRSDLARWYQHMRHTGIPGARRSAPIGLRSTARVHLFEHDKAAAIGMGTNAWNRQRPIRPKPVSSSSSGRMFAGVARAMVSYLRTSKLY